MKPEPPPDLFGDVTAPASPPPAKAFGYVRVALERSIDRAGGGLTYALPEALRDVAVGERVEVPLGRGDQPVRGIVVQHFGGVTSLDELGLSRNTKLKFVTARTASPDAPASTSDAGDGEAGGDATPAPGRRGSGLPADLVELGRWIAAYYCCPLGMVYASMMPAAVKRRTGLRSRLQARLPRDAAPESAPGRRLTPLQNAVLDAARQTGRRGQWIDAQALARTAGAKSTAVIKTLAGRGLLQTRRARVVVSDLDLRAQRTATDQPRPELTHAQRDAVDRLAAAIGNGFSVHLLHGVTGSGKTEVYLRAIEALRVRGEGSGIRDQGSGSECVAEGVGPDLIPDPRSLIPTPGVIVLVPEIALTPQTVGRFLSRFEQSSAVADGSANSGLVASGGGFNTSGGAEGSGVAVLHSGLTDAQRHAQWQRIRSGQASIVIGARSAIFAPLPRVDLIIVDEEHESSYKQDQLPRYHARDVAIKRGQLAGCPVLLGSATPSLESYFNAVGTEDRGSGAGDREEAAIRPALSDTDAGQVQSQGAKYQLLRLPDRVPGAQLPRVEIVDLARERRERRGIHLLSARLESALQANLDLGGQAMLLLNRRGYANYLACPDHRCGWMMRCHHCDVTMVFHRGGAMDQTAQGPGGRVKSHSPHHLAPEPRSPSAPSAAGTTRCHHCLAEQPLVNVCPESGHKISVFGLGTQRVEEELVRKFPKARLERMDADAMRTARHYQQTLDRFASGQTDILLGTQMIAKGLDVANVRLVGVVSGDTSLNFPDFRASERTFQLIAQVAGRAGRAQHRGRVIVQSFNPDDPAIRLAAAHDYEGFATRELAIRAEAGLPPVGRMARIVLRDVDHVANTRRAHELAAALRQAIGQMSLAVRLRGPTICPIARIADHHRQQIELFVAPPAGPAQLQKLLTALRNAGQLISDTHTAVDVDPVALL